jgi:hypothetical protein
LIAKNAKVEFRACLNFVFADENRTERVLGKLFLSRMAALRGGEKVKPGSFIDNLQRKG